MKNLKQVLFGLLMVLMLVGCESGSTELPKKEEPVTYTVTYLGNGNSSGTVPAVQEKKENESLTLAINSGALARKSCVFDGWNTEADGTGTNYAEGTTFSGNANLTLYAKWIVSPTITIGFSHWGVTEGWPQMQYNSIADAITAKDYTLLFNDAENSQENQIQALRDFIEEEVDIIILVPIAESGWTTVLQDVQEAGIPVVLVDRMVSENESLCAAYVSYDFEAQGRKIAEALVAFKGNTTVRILELEGVAGQSATVGRKAGFQAVIAQHPTYSIVRSVSAGWDQAQGQAVTAQAIEDSIEFDVVYAQNDPMAFGAITAIQNASMEVGIEAGQITILGNDCGKVALERIYGGEIYASCECPPFQGPLTVETCEKVLIGTLVNKTIFMPDQVYTKSNLTQEIIDAREY